MKTTASLTIAAALFAVATTASAERSGKDVYSTKCFVCHASGAAGAPKFGNKDDWAPRIAKGEDAMMETIHKGKGGMPPKGTCADCSDAELKAAMEYMVNAAK
ncbi:MAG TPA: cytochrome c5 family protein [Gammaproteobacteria bacterium]|nr:cytochrome c5 family protein [Gammaproteobacteria bacterium]